MRSKILALAAVCLLGIACAGAMGVKKQASNFYEGKTFDEVWAASLKSIMDIGFTIKESEKSSGFIYAQGGRNVITQNNPPQLNILIKDEAGKIRVDCQAMQPGQIVDYGAGKKNINKFLGALNVNLK